MVNPTKQPRDFVTTASTAVTPMMAQFMEIKEAHKDALLFYRMGDFYEMFFEDAVAAAEALDIALTKRGKHLGQDIPMCGVPVHSAEGYLLTLIRKGFRVAVCEQMEDPAEAKKRGSKSVVKRGVVRLVTPGTLTEESLLEARRHNFLAAFAEVRDEAALAWVDISTGAFRVMTCPPVRLSPELARLGPREVVVSEAKELELAEIVSESGAALTPLARSAFDSTAAESRLTGLFGVGTLEAFGNFTRAEMSAMGAIVEYLDITQKGRLPLLRPPVQPGTDGEPVGRARRLASFGDRPHRNRRRGAAAGTARFQPVARSAGDPRAAGRGTFHDRTTPVGRGAARASAQGARHGPRPFTAGA